MHLKFKIFHISFFVFFYSFVYYVSGRLFIETNDESTLNSNTFLVKKKKFQYNNVKIARKIHTQISKKKI